MQDESNADSTKNRRSVLKTLSAGALATTILGGAASAAHKESTDDGVGAANCVDEWYEYQCVDSGCDCSDCGCDCDTKQQRRECCEDSIGHVFCGGWSDTGYCCSSC